MTTTSSQDLMLNVAKGDRAAFDEVYERFSGLARAAAMRVLGAGLDVEDVCQDVFMSVWRDARLYDPNRGSPSTWIGLLARRRAVDCLRARILRRSKLADIDIAYPAAARHDHHEEDACERAEGARRAREVIARLPEDQRSALTLTVLAGLKGRQVAAIQKVPCSTVKTRIRRGMLRMRRILDQEAA